MTEAKEEAGVKDAEEEIEEAVETEEAVAIEEVVETEEDKKFSRTTGLYKTDGHYGNLK
jgi:hypothetical protein